MVQIRKVAMVIYWTNARSRAAKGASTKQFGSQADSVESGRGPVDRVWPRPSGRAPPRAARCSAVIGVSRFEFFFFRFSRRPVILSELLISLGYGRDGCGHRMATPWGAWPRPPVSLLIKCVKNLFE